MAELKTKPTTVRVAAFLNAIPDEARRKDCKAVAKMMEEVTGEKPKMWGPSIVGFGQYHYKYASGHEGDMCRLGFSPRKKDLTLYLYGLERQSALLKQLGKCAIGKACLYLNKLEGLDMSALAQLMENSLIALDEIIAMKKAEARR